MNTALCMGAPELAINLCPMRITIMLMNLAVWIGMISLLASTFLRFLKFTFAEKHLRNFASGPGMENQMNSSSNFTDLVSGSIFFIPLILFSSLMDIISYSVETKTRAPNSPTTALEDFYILKQAEQSYIANQFISDYI